MPFIEHRCGALPDGCMPVDDQEHIYHPENPICGAPAYRQFILRTKGIICHRLWLCEAHIEYWSGAIEPVDDTPVLTLEEVNG